MIRRLGPGEWRRRESARRSLDAFVGERKPAAPKRPPPLAVRRFGEQVDQMLAADPHGRTELWKNAKPSHLVELYRRWHLQVYGVEPAELEGEQVKQARIGAANLLAREFRGDGRNAFQFIGWVFVRAANEEKRRKSRGESDGWRLRWSQLFRTKALLTDYKVAVARKRGSG